MYIKDLFEILQEEYIVEQLKGELTLDGNCIIWSFDVKDDINDENESHNDTDDIDYEEFSFNIKSACEILEETYGEDFILIEKVIDEYDALDNWTFSSSEIWKNNISFKIF